MHGIGPRESGISYFSDAGFLLRAGTRVIYPAMTLHVPGYRPDGRSFFSVTCVRLDSQ